MREDLIDFAKQQAAEIARAGHNGWGNTMLELAAALEAAREDAERLDWLDTQRSDDVQGSYPDEPQLVWHYWDIDSPDCTDVRDAIDQARGKGGAGK